MSGKSKHPEQCAGDAVELTRSSDRPLRQVAHELDIDHKPAQLVRTAEQAQAAPVDTAAVDQAQLRALRRRVAELELPREHR